MNRALLLCTVVTAACLPLPPEHIYDDARTVTVSWSLLGPADSPGTCPAGFDTVTLAACLQEDAYECFTQTVPCAPSGSVAIDVYTKGRYHSPDGESTWDLSPTFWVYAAIVDSSGEDERARSELHQTDLTSGDAQVAVSLYPDAGFLRLGWQLSSAASGDTVDSCSAVDIDEIELAYTAASGGAQKHVRWPCMHRSTPAPDDNLVGDGDTPALAPGAYTGSVIAYRAGAEVARADDTTFTIGDGGKLDEEQAYLEIPDR